MALPSLGNWLHYERHWTLESEALVLWGPGTLKLSLKTTTTAQRLSGCRRLSLTAVAQV